MSASNSQIAIITIFAHMVKSQGNSAERTSQALVMDIRILKWQCFFIQRFVGDRSDFQPAVEIRNRNRKDRAISAHSGPEANKKKKNTPDGTGTKT